MFNLGQNREADTRPPTFQAKSLRFGAEKLFLLVAHQELLNIIGAERMNGGGVGERGGREGAQGGRVALVSAERRGEEAGGQEESPSLPPLFPLSGRRRDIELWFPLFSLKTRRFFKERRRRLYDRAMAGRTDGPTTKLPPQIINRPGAMKVCRRRVAFQRYLQMRVACPVLVLSQTL